VRLTLCSARALDLIHRFCLLALAVDVHGSDTFSVRSSPLARAHRPDGGQRRRCIEHAADMVPWAGDGRHRIDGISNNRQHYLHNEQRWPAGRDHPRFFK
jgi:hypothetical protein